MSAYLFWLVSHDPFQSGLIRRTVTISSSTLMDGEKNSRSSNLVTNWERQERERVKVYAAWNVRDQWVTSPWRRPKVKDRDSLSIQDNTRLKKLITQCLQATWLPSIKVVFFFHQRKTPGSRGVSTDSTLTILPFLKSVYTYTKWICFVVFIRLFKLFCGFFFFVFFFFLGLRKTRRMLFGDVKAPPSSTKRNHQKPAGRLFQKSHYRGLRHPWMKLVSRTAARLIPPTDRLDCRQDKTSIWLQKFSTTGRVWRSINEHESNNKKAVRNGRQVPTNGVPKTPNLVKKWRAANGGKRNHELNATNVFFFLFPFFFWLLVLPVGRANRQANKCRKVFYLNEFSGIIHNNKTTVTTTTVAFSARILPFSSSKATHTQEEEKK